MYEGAKFTWCPRFIYTYQFMMTPKLITFYFPQFHAIPENDKWWGNGFNDWQLVQQAKPNFSGHNQPRIPLDRDYYNPCDKNTLIKQVRLAREYGIGGFSFYHYWFDGKLLLEKPLETFLANEDINIPFCLTWANETWTRCWIGQPEAILQQQTHKKDKDIWIKHFNYLLPFWKDKRAIKIDEKPLFLVYQPFILKHTKEMFALWTELAKENGLNGIYFMAVKGHQFNSEDFLEYYNGILKSQPREAFGSPKFKNQNLTDKLRFLRLLPESVQNYLRKINQKIYSYKIINAKEIWNVILDNAFVEEFKNKRLDVYEAAFFDWDNTARYKDKAKIYAGISDKEREDNLLALMDKAKENGSPYFFFNAWNEWSEGAYLEPDTKNGYRYLEIVRKVDAIISQ